VVNPPSGTAKRFKENTELKNKIAVIINFIYFIYHKKKNQIDAII
jgi:hypothetical protein